MHSPPILIIAMTSSFLPHIVVNCWKDTEIRILNFSPYTCILLENGEVYSLQCYCESFESIHVAKMVDNKREES